MGDRYAVDVFVCMESEVGVTAMYVIVADHDS